MHEETIMIGETGLHVVREGAGPPLLFLVGLGGRADFWKPQMRLFGARYATVSFDHRKAGDSLPSDVCTTVEVLANDALALLDRLEIDRPIVIGHSLGGAIAQHIAVHAPERVKGLVLSASWAGPTPYFQRLFDLRKQVLRECGAEAYMLQGNLLGNPGWWMAANIETAMAGIAERLKAFAGVEIEIERMDAVTGHDLRDRVGSITAPCRVICARDDQITPLPLSEELAERIPGAKLMVLATGNHFAPVTVRAEYDTLLAEALADIEAEVI
ncbi:putative aminoacrylate hydrolase RutD [Erythrobacter sp. Dej080120_24]|uniref:alpha/beta fold hydrolase n=1 Tax=Erythrobacter sp. Dej080120_24 TaxID=3024837 RepID=UPI00291CD1B9|nr:putative aminoacrylate hydrolase RutD [Erythrobacter sp. Dej080120_24]